MRVICDQRSSRSIKINHKTTILTDHESLGHMNSVTRPSKRLPIWIDEFQELDLDIRYRRGKFIRIAYIAG